MQLPHTENFGTERIMRGLRHTRGGSRLAPLLALFLTALAARSAAAQDIVRITVQPTTVELATDEVILLTAQATFSDGSVADMSELVEWKSSNTGVVKVSNTNGTKGKITAKAAGHASISVLDPVSGVTSGQSGGSAAIVVLGRLTSIAVTPQNRRIEVGSTRSMQAIGTFSDGQTRDLTEQVTWTSSDPNVARVSNDPGQRGRVTALAPGTVHIAAASSTGITSTGTGGDATVRVPADLISIQITPSVNRLPIGLTLSLNATGTFSDGSTNDVSNQVTWTSSAPLVASVSNDAGSQGDVTALTNGSVLISVLDATTGISSTPSGGDALVNVAGALVALTLNPTNDQLPIGFARAFSVKATLDDGSTISLSRRMVQWSSSNPEVATISNDPGKEGIATAVARGTTVVSAVHAPTGIRSNPDATLTVVGNLVALTVRPKTRDLFTGQTERFSAFAVLDDGTSVKLTRDIQFLSSDGSIATASNQSGSRGDVTGLAKGRSTISVVHTPTGLSSSAFGGDGTVTVRGRVESLRVYPALAFYPVGTDTKVKARATLDDGSSANIGSVVVWTSSDPSIAEVGNVSPKKGVLTAKTVGRITISAVEPVSGVTTSPDGDGIVTVVDGLQSLKVHLGNDLLRTGDTFKLRADGTFPNPSAQAGEPNPVTVDITSSVDFFSNNPAVVRVDNGQVIAVGLGQTTVTAKDRKTGLVSTSDPTFTVVAALNALKITPPRIKMRLGSTQRRGFTVIGSYTDRARVELTDKVTFSTADPTIAQVSNDPDRHGLVMPLAAGVTTVVASEPITGVQSTRQRRIIVKPAPRSHQSARGRNP